MVRLFLALALALFGLSALATEVVATSGAKTVTLSDKPCTDDIVILFMTDPRTAAMIGEHAADLLHAAIYRDASSETAGCWMRLDAQQVFLRYSDGDAGVIPMTAFKPVETY